ncbi:hypothetical protein, partial [Klebsiella pneumoniae]|uniref:hypothetical protein n=1 Tax=Klebsiella pneumoniae TaxID=573 RepID=UPI0039C3CAA2
QALLHCMQLLLISSLSVPTRRRQLIMHDRCTLSSVLLPTEHQYPEIQDVGTIQIIWLKLQNTQREKNIN